MPCLAGRLHPEDVEKALSEKPDAKAVYVTSPDYYGVLADIQGLSSVCHAHGVPLLVDNAHGIPDKRIHVTHDGMVVDS